MHKLYKSPLASHIHCRHSYQQYFNSLHASYCNIYNQETYVPRRTKKKESHYALSTPTNFTLQMATKRWHSDIVSNDKPANKTSSQRATLLNEISLKRFFYEHSNKIYNGGIAGFLDFGPLGVQLKRGLLDEWHEHFVYEDELYELESSILTSSKVFQASGHCDRFDTGLFETTAGTKEKSQVFLRPETAQGVFVNFRQFASLNRNKLPFGVAQVGKSFRNEQGPHGYLVRLREFTQAEIEYFISPFDKSHLKYDSIKHVKINILTRKHQNVANPERYQTLTVDDAFKMGVFSSQTIAYYIAKIHLYMENIGIDVKNMRFRQHMSDEMAHYSSECWDCECFVDGAWLECVGCSDRAGFDLTRHSSLSKARLTIDQQLREPIVPHVIEPSFGVDRIIYTLMEHNFHIRDNLKDRTYFSFKPNLSPIQCQILPIIKNSKLVEEASIIKQELRKRKIRASLNLHDTIGVRYSRSDEIGVPYAIVIDTKTLQEGFICVRERNSMESRKIDAVQLVDVVKDLIRGKLDWNKVRQAWPASDYNVKK